MAVSDFLAAQLPRLRRALELRRTQITAAGLAHLSGLTQLERLDLRDTRVTDADLVHLRVLTSLRQLEINDTNVTDAGVAELQQALPALTIKR